MRPQTLSILVGLVSLATTGSMDAYARTAGLVESSLVDHPVHHPTSGRTPSAWKNGVGAWGEQFADKTLRLRGFNEVHEIKTGSNNGIDRIAVKRTADGAISDFKFVEVKTSRGGKPKLGETKRSGRQMSRKWLADHLKDMRRSGDPTTKKLALEISRFRKASMRSIESFGEVMHFDTKSGNVTGYLADGTTKKYSYSAERLLKRLQSRANPLATRMWAAKHLASLDQIRSTCMTSWLGRTPTQQNSSMLLAVRVQSEVALEHGLANQTRRIVLKRILLRSAGPIVVIVALAIDAKEIADVEAAYRRGSITVRQRNILHFSKAGGMAGALVGASAGGMTVLGSEVLEVLGLRLRCR